MSPPCSGDIFVFTPLCVVWSDQCAFKPGSPTSHGNIKNIWSPVNLMQVFRRQELQPPLKCLRCAKCYSSASHFLQAQGGHDTRLERRLVEKRQSPFLFNVKCSGFVVLSVDIKVFPLPHYPHPNLTPYRPPTGVSPLNLLSHPPFHPWFEVLLPPVCQLETSWLLLSRQGPSRPQ